MWFVRDSQRVLPSGGSCLVPNGHHRAALRLHVFMQSLPMREALGVATSTNKKKAKVSPHMAESSLRVLIDNSTVWAEGLCFPPMLIDCLTRHPCQWKFVSRNSLSVPMWKSRGTMAVKLGGPAFTKVDRAAGRCFSKLF